MAAIRSARRSQGTPRERQRLRPPSEATSATDDGTAGSAAANHDHAAARAQAARHGARRRRGARHRRSRIAAQFWTEVLWYQSVGFSRRLHAPSWCQGRARRHRWAAHGRRSSGRASTSPTATGRSTRRRRTRRRWSTTAQLVEPMRRTATIAAPARHRALRRPVGGHRSGTPSCCGATRSPSARPTRSSASTSASSSSTCRGSTSSSPSSRWSSSSASSPRPSRTTSTAASSPARRCARRRPPGCTCRSSRPRSCSCGPWRSGSTATTSRRRSRRRMTGIQYTEAHAVIPTKGILAIAAVMCAVMFVATIWTRSWRLPLVGVAVLAVIVGGGRRHLPGARAVAQGRPVGEVARGALHPAQHRRDASGIRLRRASRSTPTTPNTVAEPGQLRGDATTVPGIRLIDPNVVSPTFKQLEASKGYYQFADVLDVDRYKIDGELTDTVIAARELDLERRARRAAQLAQRPHRLHARLRRRRGQGQHPRGRRPAQLLRVADRHRGQARQVRAAHLLRRAVAGVLHRRRRQEGVRLPGPRRAPGRSPTPMQGTGGVELDAVQADRLRDQVPRDQLPALRRGHQRLAHPRPPHPPRPRPARRPVADARRQRLPRRRRRPGAVDPRRLHDLGQLPLLRDDDARPGDRGLA